MKEQPPIDLSALKAKVRADRAAEPKVAMPTWQRVLGTAVVGVGLPTAFGLFTLRPDFPEHPLFQLSLYYGALLVGLVAVAIRANRPLHRVYRPDAWVWVVVALAIPVIIGVLPPAHRAHPASLGGIGEEFWGAAIGCLIGGVVAAAVPFIVARLFDRSPNRWVGDGVLMAALFGGLAGNAFLLLHCPVVWSGHQLAGHATVGVVYLVGVAIWWLVSRPTDKA